jgi:hypothetical protein
MNTNSFLIRIALTLGMIALISSAFAANYSEPAPSGITDAQVKDLSLGELNDLIRKIRRENTRYTHSASGAQCGIVHSTTIDNKSLMTQSQWETVSKRVATAIVIDDGQEFMDALYLEVDIVGLIRNDDQQFERLNFQRIVDAAITRFHDPDPEIAQYACTIAFQIPPSLPIQLDLMSMIELVESAPTLTHKEHITKCIGWLRFKYPQPAEVDAAIVESARAILEDEHAEPSLRSQAFISIQYATRASGEAATLATEHYNRTPHNDRFRILQMLSRLLSFHDNPNPESREIAANIALPIFIQAANSTHWSLQMSGAGSARFFRERAEPLIPALLSMLDHQDPNVRGMAIDALGRIGPAANVAVPKLREMKKDNPNFNEIIDDTLYLITKEGEKPDWYDRHIATLKEAGIEIED